MFNEFKFVTPLRSNPTPPKRGPGALGPVAWCHRCHRRHPRRGCALVLEERIAKSGRKVMRLVHAKVQQSRARTT